MTRAALPLLPLVLDRVPPSLAEALAQAGVPTCDVASDTSGTFVLYDSHLRSRPVVRAGQIAVDVDPLRREFTHDPFLDLENPATCRTWWQVGPWEACEETSAVDRRTLRANLLEALRRQIEALGGVWMNLAPVPFPYRTAFNFRFDHDAFIADDFAAVMDAIAGREVMTTHFVCAATHPNGGDALRRLDGCDVGSHGYRHHTYRTFDENRLNIARGIETLRTLGFEPSGFAAPHGRFGAESAAAIASLGISHSSEFAAAYDDWPFFPTTSRDVLQLPIHPVCLGIVLEAATNVGRTCDEAEQQCAADDVADYFIATAEAKRAAREPIFLYGHPDGRLGRHPHILRRLLTTVENWSDVWRTSLSEFQHWWRARGRVMVAVRATADGYVIDTARRSSDYEFALEWHVGDGTATVLLDRQRVVVSRGAKQFVRRESVEVPRPIRRETLGGWERLRRVLDWEYATPIDEIDVRLWRGRLKRSLRLWKARAA